MWIHSAKDIDVNTLSAKDIDVNTLSAKDIDVNTLSAKDIDVNTLSAKDIDVNTLSAKDIDVNALSAKDIDVNTLSAKDIDFVTECDLIQNYLNSENDEDIVLNRVISKYYDGKKFNSMKIDLPSSFGLFHANIASLNLHIDVLNLFYQGWISILIL